MHVRFYALCSHTIPVLCWLAICLPLHYAPGAKAGLRVCLVNFQTHTKKQPHKEPKPKSVRLGSGRVVVPSVLGEAVPYGVVEINHLIVRFSRELFTLSFVFLSSTYTLFPRTKQKTLEKNTQTPKNARNVVQGVVCTICFVPRFFFYLSSPPQ